MNDVSNSPMIAAIRSFLGIALGPAKPELPALARALDELALAYHLTPAGTLAGGDIDPPETDYEATRAKVGPRFPALGFYGVAAPLAVAADSMVGDAIDDLADMVDELSTILWRWDHLGPENARWHFYDGFQTHWGRHLRQLQSFLHAQLFES